MADNLTENFITLKIYKKADQTLLHTQLVPKDLSSRIMHTWLYANSPFSVIAETSDGKTINSAQVF